MNTLEIVIIAWGLAMDCFAVAIACGISLKQIQWKPMLIISLMFGLFQAVMPVIGWSITYSFSSYVTHIDHWLAFALLSFLGGRMIKESFLEEEEKKMVDPTKFSIILAMAIATSIDALAIGISFACLGMNRFHDITTPVCIIGWVSFFFSLAGLLIGILCRKGIARKLKAERWGGLLLILIGIKILIEHLFFN